MKYILLLLLIASLAACKKDTTNALPKSIYTTWFIEMDGASFTTYLGDASHYDSFVPCARTCSSFCGYLYNVQIGDSIMAQSAWHTGQLYSKRVT